MWRKRKLTRKRLDELAKIMPVLSEKEQRECIGGYGVRGQGSGAPDDPIMIEQTFNIASYSFGKNGDSYYNAIESSIRAFNNQGLHEIGGKYYQLYFTCNQIPSSQDYEEIHVPGDKLIIGSDRYKVYSKEGTEDAPVLGGAGENSGAVGYYGTIEDTIGSGAVAYDAMTKVMIHEIGHIFGLGENQFPMMGGFNTDTGVSPGSIDSGAIKKMLENNVNYLGIK